MYLKRSPRGPSGDDSPLGPELKISLADALRRALKLPDDGKTQKHLPEQNSDSETS